MNTFIARRQEIISDRQHNRILRLTFPHNERPDCKLVVNRLHAHESVSRDFEFTIELLSDKADLALRDMADKLLSVALVQADGPLRYFSDYCFTFHLKKAANVPGLQRGTQLMSHYDN